jgi:hypothetical protein
VGDVYKKDVLQGGQHHEPGRQGRYVHGRTCQRRHGRRQETRQG